MLVHPIPSKLRAARTARWAVVAGAVLAVGAVGAVARAQPTTVSPPPAPDGQVGFQRRAQLTPAQEVAQSELTVVQMKSSSGTTQRMLAQARLARDVVKTLCLNDKLSQIDVAAKTAAERLQALKAAAARNDLEGSSHQFIILTVLKQRNDQLVAEANQCIGQENAFLGATNIVTTVDPTLPLTPVTDMPPDLTPVSVIPVSGSSGL
jgi:hypothetical protein